MYAFVRFVQARHTQETAHLLNDILGAWRHLSILRIGSEVGLLHRAAVVGVSDAELVDEHEVPVRPRLTHHPPSHPHSSRAAPAGLKSWWKLWRGEHHAHDTRLAQDGKGLQAASVYYRDDRFFGFGAPNHDKSTSVCVDVDVWKRCLKKGRACGGGETQQDRACLTREDEVLNCWEREWNETGARLRKDAATAPSAWGWSSASTSRFHRPCTAVVRQYLQWELQTILGANTSANIKGANMEASEAQHTDEVLLRGSTRRPTHNSPEGNAHFLGARQVSFFDGYVPSAHVCNDNDNVKSASLPLESTHKAHGTNGTDGQECKRDQTSTPPPFEPNDSLLSRRKCEALSEGEKCYRWRRKSVYAVVVLDSGKTGHVLARWQRWHPVLYDDVVYQHHPPTGLSPGFET